MAYIQNQLPPVVKSLNFVFNNFTGGLNNVTSDVLLKENESPDLLNMAFNDEGTMEKRKGTKLYKDYLTAFPEEIVYLDKYRTPGGADRLVTVVMGATSGALYVDHVLVCTVAKKPCGVNYLGAYYFVDGSTNVRVYGKFPQATSGDHIKVIGTPIATLTLMTRANPTTGFTPLGTTFTTGVWTYNYTLGLIIYEPCANELADAKKGANLKPTNPSIIMLYKDRLVMDGDLINPGNVFLTDIDNAFYNPVGLPMQLPPNGLPITGMRVFSDSIVVGRKEDMYAIYGNTNIQSTDGVFIVKKINTHTGFMNNNAISEAHNYLFYLGSDGVVYQMHTTQTDVSVLATTEISKQLNLFKYPISLDFAKLKKCFSIFDNDKFYLFHKDVTLVYSYKFMAWTMYKGIKANCAVVMNDELVIGSNDCLLYGSSETYSDNGYPIVAYWSSKALDLGVPSNYKQFKELYIISHVYDEFTSNIDVRYEIDYVDVFQTATILNQISKWGKAVWGSRFITRNISPSLAVTIGRRGKKLRFIIKNGYALTGDVATYTDLALIETPIHLQIYRVRDINKYYRYSLGEYVEFDSAEVLQPMKVYEINGEYNIKGKR